MQTHLKNQGRTRLALIVAGLTFVLLMPGLPPRSTVSADSNLATLRVGLLEPIDSLNPFMGINDNAYIFYGLVYDDLIAVDQDLNPKPDLAVSWNIVKDELPVGSVWQYNLTHNARWHDGEPFTADDVVFTMNLQSGTNWFKMWAYQPYTLMVNYTEKIDDYTVRIHFYNRLTGEPTAIAFGESVMVPIVPKHLFEGMSVEDISFSYPNPHPVGTGPFMCTDRTYEEFLRGERITLLRNPNYHIGPVKYDRLILEFYLEPAAMVTDMQRGAVDVAAFTAPNFKNLMDWLSSNPTSSIGTYTGLICTSYSVETGICMADAPGTNFLRHDPAVRRAMALATDKEFIKDHIYMGYADIGYSIISPICGDWYWEPNETELIPYDIDMANQVLDDAGYIWNPAHTVRMAAPDNPYISTTNELSFTVLVETELFEDRAVAMFLKEEWAQIGIDLNLNFVDSATWNSIVYNSGGAFEMEMTYWSGDPDPNYLLYTQSTDALSGWSENYYSNPEYDYNYTESVLSVNHTERVQYVHNCLKHIYEDNAFIVNVYPWGCWAWRTDHFSGWGDWGAHPGRQLSNFWTANDLFFDLEPIATNQAPTSILDNAGGHPGEPVQITAYGWDPEGDSMTYLMEFGDGENLTGAVPSDGEMSFTHTYASAGSYSMSLAVYDDTSGNFARSRATIVPTGTNLPPTNVRLLPDPMSGAQAGEEMTFDMRAMDQDNDEVVLTLDFGDGSAPYEKTVTNTAQIFTETAKHKYVEPGDYTVTLNVTDGTNYTVVTTDISLAKASTSNTLVIIGVLGAVVIVAVAAVILMKKRKPGKRKKKEEEDVQLP
jgi:peptide/nickel transport system substrate-binding protein